MSGKQPKLVLREACIADVTRSWPVGRFFEAGAGTGHMSSLFLARGFTGVSHDLGESSRSLMRDRFQDSPSRMKVVDDIDQLADGTFDYLLAFEVLEHIENDVDMLSSWARKLRPNGRILVSVPAHQRKFGASDAMVGHVRRYERANLHQVLGAAGFTDIQMVNYGWPLTELTRRVSNRLIGVTQEGFDGLSAAERSIRSAQAKPAVINKVLKVASGNAFVPFTWIQRLFYRFDLGDGLVAWGTRA
ncbi:MAG TPA: class I SAM-dependent methyltransferase [Luteibacter sp.]|uniref:class I SAM-dependent methyltransferase n=1 Tax=Luteibacter sp. TaxID=1886636 RepID=UPI002CEFBA6B|nr:class I SAM-dependent methyltransferase [Luteibacter sp.]HVI55383.1 class I SAM-dependent methyltransferase [Luteibacter sp.]